MSLPLFRPAQVRAMDQRAFGAGVEESALMECAAGHLARAVLAAGGRGYGLRVGIVCGKGNNGGDGLAAARLLLSAGAFPLVHVLGGAEALEGVPAIMRDRFLSVGGRIADELSAAIDGADVVVDCLLGTGTSGAPRPPYDAAVHALNAAPAPTVACDLPTGVDADTGAVPGEAIRAAVTVTLAARKRGLYLAPASAFVGRLVVGALGLVTAEDRPAAHVLEVADVAALVPEPEAGREKRTAGVVVVLAGSPGMAGAAVLAARGAYAAGAGLVTVATADVGLVTTVIPEALTAEVDVTELPEEALARLRDALEGADALVVGPGLGHGDAQQRIVRRLVAETELPLVLDADGLNVFRHEAGRLADHASPLLVGTPHRRELARLLGEDVWDQRVERVPEMATEIGATLVAKGPGSLVAAPGGDVWVNPTGGPALATGGTGDVLSGLTGALVAQVPEPATVAAAVWLHGRAGDLAAAAGHPRSVTALDVAASMPQALCSLRDPG